MKACSKCKIEKELDKFGKNKSKKDGRQTYCKECAKAYYKANKESISEWGKLYREKNKEARSEYIAQWREANKEHIGNYEKDRKATHPTYKLICNMRSRVNSALNGTAKVESTIKLLGCTPEQLKEHLENQFTEGMAWGQQGLWHIDHQLPCAAFDLTDKKQQSYAFHWSNLQPLWAADNLAKSDSYDPEELEKYLKSELPTYE
jgi:hypothetical protein